MFDSVEDLARCLELIGRVELFFFAELHPLLGEQALNRVTGHPALDFLRLPRVRLTYALRVPTMPLGFGLD